MTPDGTPVIGAAGPDGLYLNTGHGTLGWTTACGSARVLADLLDGRRPEIKTGDLSLGRYATLRRLGLPRHRSAETSASRHMPRRLADATAGRCRRPFRGEHVSGRRRFALRFPIPSRPIRGDPRLVGIVDRMGGAWLSGRRFRQAGPMRSVRNLRAAPR